MRSYCVFCRIVAREEPADILYEDDDIIVIRNLLRWAPVMLLAMVKKHTTQTELWNEHIARVGKKATELGHQHCPGGFRLVSNFGFNGKQSQEHGHLHIVGGAFLGDYIN